MKILNSSGISAFGGLNFVIQEVIKLNINEILIDNLPELPKQSQYNWFDIFMSYWSVFFCGGTCAEDLAINLRSDLQNNPFIKIPSPDTILNRIKSLADSTLFLKAKRGNKEHQFSFAQDLNSLNLKLLSQLPNFKKNDVILDYDNTVIFTEKSDAQRTYQRDKGYNPGVGIIDKHIVYVENRNGSSCAHILQHETITRMCTALNNVGVSIDAVRADSASYTYEILKAMESYSKRIFMKARMTNTLERAIANIDEWKEIQIGDKIVLRGSTFFTPFKGLVRNKSKAASLNEYRVVITKEVRRDGQLNLFTGEAYDYSPIITNDFEMTDDEVVYFYNARGAKEREFDILKNDFGWNRMPFSKLEQNSVFLLITAMCRNIYSHMIEIFSAQIKHLSPHFRIKKFIFRFICIPAKWIKTGRENKLRLYGKIAFKT